MKRILIVEDDCALSNGISLALRNDELSFIQASDLRSAQREVESAALLSLGYSLMIVRPLCGQIWFMKRKNRKIDVSHRNPHLTTGDKYASYFAADMLYCNLKLTFVERGIFLSNLPLKIAVCEKEVRRYEAM